jgi:predicted DNA-binding protein
LYKPFIRYLTFVFMKKRSVSERILQSDIKQILISFSFPKTPRMVERELGISKLKMNPLVDADLLTSLNPIAKKGRFYILTNKARRALGLQRYKNVFKKDWVMIGWILASPKQRLVVLKTMDSIKRPSEEIRERASRLNSNLSRISTKGILKELIEKGLVKSEIIERKRYYWIAEKGKMIANDLD